MPSPLTIAIFANTPAQQRRLSQLLANHRMTVLPADTPLSEASELDLIVSDGPIRDQLGPHAARVEQGLIGTLALGEAAADVNLLGDVSDREIELACRLLGQIVRMRRRQAETGGQLRALQKLANSDSLTSLPNRRCWQTRLKKMCIDRSVGIVMLDLDNFKQVNDRLGHASGDEVLVEVARQLVARLEEGEMLARIGGDEFGLLLPQVDNDSLAARIEQLRAPLDVATVCDVEQIFLSAGFVLATAEGTTAQQLYVEVANALRQAKRAGGNQSWRAGS
jgi:diguanylate cyclase (GGDEF)-like protein